MRRHPEDYIVSKQEPYSGVENLEVMTEARNYNQYLLDLILRHAATRDSILDFGAGAGTFVVRLAELGLNIMALEPDEFLRNSLLNNGVRAVASLDELPETSFQLIYTLNVLEHIQDDQQALRQLRSRLEPQGTLLIYVPAFPILFTSMDTRVGHFRRYTRNELAQRVSAAGLQIEQIEYADSLGFLATLLFKMIGSKDGTVNRRALKIYDRLVFPVSAALDSVTRRRFGKNLLVVARNLD
jgi:SAM-dependent methyltransferase